MKVRIIVFELLITLLPFSKCNRFLDKRSDEQTGHDDGITVSIPKFCSVGYVVMHPTYDCTEVVAGQNWTSFVYDSNTLKRIDSSTVRPNYTHAKAGLPSCKNDSWDFLLNYSPQVSVEGESLSLPSSLPTERTDSIQSYFILLSNGEFRWKSEKCTCGKCNWIPARVKLFVDGLGFPVNNGTHVLGASYSGREIDQAIYYCKSEINDDDAAAVYHAEYNLRNDKISVAILFSATFLYMITTIIYGVLWSGNTLPGRVLFSVVLSRMMMSFLLGLGYVGKLYRWDILAIKWCTVVAVSAHYFMISSYSWVTVLNFDLWFTFRSLRRISEQEGRTKKYLVYSCFGWGVPFLLTLVSVVVDSVYKNNTNISVAYYKLVPNYGNGICFVVDCAYGLYVHAFTILFLAPALVFSVLTLYALFIYRTETANIRDAKHGEKKSSFLLYVKLVVMMSISWTIGHIVWYFQAENDGSSASYQRQTILLVLHWVVDLLGTSAFILIVFGCDRRNRLKLHQNYKIIAERIRSTTSNSGVTSNDSVLSSPSAHQRKNRIHQSPKRSVHI